MKTCQWPLILLFIAGGLTVRAEEQPDLSKLRTAYNAKVADARNKLAEIYLDDLERLRNSYVRAGKADLAKEVDAEIESIRRRDISSRDDLPPSTSGKASNARIFVGGATPPDPK